MQRAWDIIVGLTMIVLGLIFQGLFAIIVAGATLAALGAWLGFDANAWILPAFVGLLVLINAIAIYEYRRRRVVSAVHGDAGKMLLVQRGVDRLWNGRELTVQRTPHGDVVSDERPTTSAGRSLAWGIVWMLVSVTLFWIGFASKGTWPLVAIGLGMILLVVAIAYFLQSLLVAIGVIRGSMGRA